MAKTEINLTASAEVNYAELEDRGEMRMGWRYMTKSNNKLRDRALGWVFFLGLLFLFIKINVVILVPFILVVMIGWWLKFIFGERIAKYRHIRRKNA